MARNPTLPVLAALALTPALAAQGFSLDKIGGGMPGNTSFQVRNGIANNVYLILYAFTEVSTPVPALGITLDIPDTYAGPAMDVPGFFGYLNAQGAANASIAIPYDPSFEGLAMAFQAIQGDGTTWSTSNKVRVTVQTNATFADTLTQPAVPILSGGVVTLPNGEFLFAGGSGPVAQRYKSRTEEWELAGATFGVGILSQSTGLADGRVLFTGGLDLTTGQPSTAAAVYDPVAGTTTNLTMALPRAGHGASLLNNGRVLISGGLTSFDLTNPLSIFNGLTNTCEIYDPATNTIIPGPTMLEARALHTSTTLTTGDVLIAGGLSLLPIVNIPTVSATAYRYSPTTNSFGFPALMNSARFFHSAAPLTNGRVLLAGGLTLDLSVFLQTGQIQDIIIGTRSDCLVYQPSLFGFGTFTAVPGMQEGRAGAGIAPLPNGGALIAGGFRLTIDIPTQTFQIGTTATADVFQQGPNRLFATGSMSAARFLPIGVRLPDNTVMMVGGGPSNAEVWQF